MRSNRKGLSRAVVVPVAMVATLLVSREVSAQGLFAGGAMGVARQYDYEFGGSIATRDESSPGYRIFGGYAFPVPNLAVAVSYVDLGTAKYDVSAFGGVTDALSAAGVDLSMIARWAPGNQTLYSVFGTLGMFRWSQHVHTLYPSETYEFDDDGTSLSYGGGAEFSVGKGGRWGMHVDYQVFTKVGELDNSSHQNDRHMISVGYDYRFRR